MPKVSLMEPVDELGMAVRGRQHSRMTQELWYKQLEG